MLLTVTRTIKNLKFSAVKTVAVVSFDVNVAVNVAVFSLQQLITRARQAVTGRQAQSAARDVAKSARERWSECRKPTSMSSASPVQVSDRS